MLIWKNKILRILFASFCHCHILFAWEKKRKKTPIWWKTILPFPLFHFSLFVTNFVHSSFSPSLPPYQLIHSYCFTKTKKKHFVPPSLPPLLHFVARRSLRKDFCVLVTSGKNPYCVTHHLLAPLPPPRHHSSSPQHLCLCSSTPEANYSLVVEVQVDSLFLSAALLHFFATFYFYVSLIVRTNYKKETLSPTVGWVAWKFSFFSLLLFSLPHSLDTLVFLLALDTQHQHLTTYQADKLWKTKEILYHAYQFMSSVK